MDENEDVVLNEYNHRLDKVKRELSEYGVEGQDGLLLSELNKMLTIEKEKLLQQGISLKQLKLQQEKQKLLQEKRIKQAQEDKIKELQELQSRQELKQHMQTIELAEKTSEPQTLSSLETEPQLDNSLEPLCIISKDDWGRPCVSRKRILCM
jgi:hypothetical protein